MMHFVNNSQNGDVETLEELIYLSENTIWTITWLWCFPNLKCLYNIIHYILPHLLSYQGSKEVRGHSFDHSFTQKTSIKDLLDTGHRNRYRYLIPLSPSKVFSLPEIVAISLGKTVQRDGHIIRNPGKEWLTLCRRA